MPRKIVARESTHIHIAETVPDHVVAAAQSLLQLQYRHQSFVDEAQRVSGCSHSEFMALRYLSQALRERRRVRASELAEMLGVTSASISKIVQHLEDQGFVERTPNPVDRRSRFIAISNAGANVIAEPLGRLHIAMVEALSQFSGVDANQFKELLVRFELLFTDHYLSPNNFRANHRLSRGPNSKTFSAAESVRHAG